MRIKFEIEAALLSHSSWRKHFRDYLNGKASIDVMTVGATDQCQFGKWLDHEGYRLMPPNFQGEIRSAHNEFHQIASKIVLNIKEKRFAEARADIALNGALNRASTRLSEILLKVSLHEAGATTPAPLNAAAPISQGTGNPAELSLTSPPPDNMLK